MVSIKKDYYFLLYIKYYIFIQYKYINKNIKKLAKQQKQIIKRSSPDRWLISKTYKELKKLDN